jgi:hypothetical protein
MRCTSVIVIAISSWLLLVPQRSEPAEYRPDLNLAPSDRSENVARALLSDYVFVGLGYIVFDYQTVPKEFYKRRPQRVVAQFNPVQVYKGDAGRGSIKISLRSDMLVVPGENVSAGVKRDQLWADLDRKRKENTNALQALESSLANGAIAQSQYEREKTRLNAVASAVSRESSQLSTVSGTVRGQHNRTFFDLDGAIKPNELYLLAVDPVLDQQAGAGSEIVYDVPLDFASLQWGQLRDDSVAVLERLAPGDRARH